MPPTGPSPATPLSQEVAAVLDDVVAGAGLALEDVEVTSAGRRRIVRVVVDLAGDEPGEVDLDAVAVASTAVSEALDASDVLGSAPYVLEVSSPGVDRPLVRRRHWSRARGRVVRAVLADGGVLVGRVVDAGEEGVVLDVQPQSVKGRPPSRSAPRGERLVPWADLVRGEVQVEFTHVADGADDELDGVDDDELDDDELDDDELDDDLGDGDDLPDEDEGGGTPTRAAGSPEED
ncbi:hypothetical protein NUM3379_13160 [Kineococcus sp. NUM-3379]